MMVLMVQLFFNLPKFPKKTKTEEQSNSCSVSGEEAVSD